MEMKGALTMTGNGETGKRRTGEDPRYYRPCPLGRGRGRKTVSLQRCLSCDYVTGSAQDKCIEIGCGFPNRSRKK